MLLGKLDISSTCQFVNLEFIFWRNSELFWCHLRSSFSTTRLSSNNSYTRPGHPYARWQYWKNAKESWNRAWRLKGSRYRTAPIYRIPLHRDVEKTEYSRTRWLKGLTNVHDSETSKDLIIMPNRNENHGLQIERLYWLVSQLRWCVPQIFPMGYESRKEQSCLQVRHNRV